MFLEISLVALVACGFFLFYDWVRGRKSRQDRASPDRAIAERQASIYSSAAIWSGVLVVVWAPIFMLPRGTECRPMGQAMISLLVLLFALPLIFVRAVLQLIVTWPKKTGWIAIAASLVPLATLILLQWLIQYVLGIVYEE